MVAKGNSRQHIVKSHSIVNVEQQGYIPETAKIASRKLQRSIIEKATETLNCGLQISSVTGRRKEFELINSCISEYVLDGRPIAVYVCGAPGTGKTSTVFNVLSNLDKRVARRLHLNWTPTTGILNATLYQTAAGLINAVVDKVFTDLNASRRRSLSRETVAKLQRLGFKAAADHLHSARSSEGDGSKRAILVIDEADQLSGIRVPGNHHGSHGLLSTLLNLSVRPGSRIFVLGISNALTLGQAVAEELSCHTPSSIATASNIQGFRRANEATPNNCSLGELRTVVFEAYSDLELRSIVEQRLSLAKDQVQTEFFNTFPSLDPVTKKDIVTSIESFQPFEAVELSLLLKRLACGYGDCRQALNACRVLLQNHLRSFADIISEREISMSPRITASPKRPQRKRQGGQLLDYGGQKRSSPPPASSCDTNEDSSRTSPASTVATSPRMEDSTVSMCEEVSPEENIHREEKIKVSITDASTILGKQFRMPREYHTDLLKNLPLQQQLLLCALCLAYRKRLSLSVPMGGPIGFPEILAEYSDLCSAHMIPPQFSGANLLEGIVALEQVGIVGLKSYSRCTSKLGGTIPASLALPRNKGCRVGNCRQLARGGSPSAANLLLDPHEVEQILPRLKCAFRIILQREEQDESCISF